MKSIALLDKTFEHYLGESEIQSLVKGLAHGMQAELQGETPLFIGVLNGAVLFFADFIRYYESACEISFVRLTSYEGLRSRGEIKTLLDIDADLTDRTVVVLEDVVDSGKTLQRIGELFTDRGAKSVEVIALFVKSDAYKECLPISRIGRVIPNRFVVGYGLDYNGLGRNLRAIYQLKEEI